MTLAELQAELAVVETAISDVVKNGQAVNISGSISYTAADLDKLRNYAQELRSRIYRKNRYVKQTQPDFNS